MARGKTTDYQSLMRIRIRRILLVCNNYDSFSLEEDGRIESRITSDYAELNLSNPPSITRAESTVEALDIVEKDGNGFDLVITMYNVGDVDVFDFSRRMKALSPDTPIVLLTSFSREIYRQIDEADTSCLDYVFCWNNSSDLIITIIKLLEDKANAEHDILESDVQAILLVEDSVRYYSTYLPLLYNLVLRQNVESLSDALNENQQILRKRARPKILLATNYDEAVELYHKYSHNLMGVISDIGFVLHKGDKSSSEKLDAGIDLCNLIRSDNPRMPILMQSSQESMRSVADSLGVGFVVKKSKTLTHEVAEYISREFGFGDFVVKDPSSGEEIGRAGDLYGVEKLFETMPREAMVALFEKNYLSKWLLARGIFSVGYKIRPMTLKDEKDPRATVMGLLHDYRMNQGLGVVARFDGRSYNDSIRFARFGDGSLGGKARGLAFLNHILQKYDLYDKWEGARVLVPRTFVITTDWFDSFIIENGLQYVINSDLSDAEILSEFVASALPQPLLDALKVFIHSSRKPLAVRSSSKLEDSYYQPFAGVYSTYMIPHTANEDQQLRLLSKAVKSVYASVYFASSRAYITATANVISEEKMAIVVQEVCGSEEGEYYLPTLSGVARSLNFYPLGYEKADEGIVKLAYGLGKAVVDGEQVLRFSPEYPKNVLQTSTSELTTTQTQKTVYALSLQPDRFKTSVDDAVNLERLSVADCASFRTLRHVASTFDMQNMRIVDSPIPEGPKFITFAHILRYGTFPLADILKTLLEIARKEMKCAVEIEFAADLDVAEGTPAIFNVLQIRPISVDSRNVSVDWSSVDDSGAMVRSSSALGTGWITGVRDIIYLKKDSFDTSKTVEMARTLSEWNAALHSEGRVYALIGFGRWGSSIPSLGVPVKWGDISECKALVECSLDNFRVYPSQGTHFFQNMTSFNVGYINVDPFSRDDFYDLSALDSLPAVRETGFVRHVRLDAELKICVDGMENRAFISVP